LPEDSQVKPKHVAVHCGFSVILNYEETVNRLALKTEVNVKGVTSMQQDAEIQY
jgi:hypothetical protein